MSLPRTSLLAVFLLSGCFHNTGVRPSEMQSVELARDRSAVIRRVDGETLRIDHLDSLTVVEKPNNGKTWASLQHEFHSPAQVELSPPLLRVQDAQRKREFAVESVDELVFSEYAPPSDRVVTVLGVSAILAGVVAAATFSSIEPRQAGSDIDSRPGEFVRATAATLGTFGLCVAITIPLTANLGRSEPRKKATLKASSAPSAGY